MASLLERFREHVTQARLFPKSGCAVVAVAGGPDSGALLDLMAEVAPALQLSLVVAHVDLGIQTGSRSVGQAVREIAGRYGLVFELGEVHLGPGATETAARRARYGWLGEVRRAHGARYLVTAHHEDDQVETVLLRVLKGSAPAGLAGMSARVRADLLRLGRAAASERRAWDRMLELVPELHVHFAAHGFEVARETLARY